MASFENNYAFENTIINQQNLFESRLRNGILMQMATELHIGLCRINGAIEDLASSVSNVSNSIDKQTEALRKRKYVLVDKFYNLYDEIVKMKYDEEKKCFMVFGKNHSWKIFITSDMDDYNFERLNTSLSYSELYDTVITLDYLVNTFGVEYSMDLFNSKINADALKGLDVLLNKSEKLTSEKASTLFNFEKMCKETIDSESEILDDEHSARTFIIFIIISLLVTIVGIPAFILTAEEASPALVGGLLIFIIFFPIVFCIVMEIKGPKKEKLSEEENYLKHEFSNIKNEYDSKIKKADSEIENFVDSFRK